MIEDASENAALVALIDAVGGQDRMWIGLNDKVTEGSFTWVRESDSVSQIPLGSYAPWDTDEPSNSNAFQDCVQLLDTGKWETRTCDQTKYFVCEGAAPPPSPPQPPTTPPPIAGFSCYADGAENTMYSSNAIGQFSTDVLALASCTEAGASSCAGVAYSPGVAASIQWSSRLTGGSTFTMAGVTWFAFTGCRRQLQEVPDDPLDENDPVYQQSLYHLQNWWEAPYAAWLAQQAHNTTGRRLSYLPDFEDDHMSPTKSRALILRRRPAAGPLYGRTGNENPNDRL